MPLKKQEANLVSKVSDLPPEVDATLFYRSINDIQTQVVDKEHIKNRIGIKADHP